MHLNYRGRERWREMEHFMQPCHQSTHSVFIPRICISVGYNSQPPALTMSDFYSPDLDDSVISLGHITTYILENDKNGNNQLEGLDFEGRIKFIWRALNEEEELREALDIENLWERRSLRKSWAEAERLRKIGNSK